MLVIKTISTAKKVLFSVHIVFANQLSFLMPSSLFYFGVTSLHQIFSKTALEKPA